MYLSRTGGVFHHQVFHTLHYRNKGPAIECDYKQDYTVPRVAKGSKTRRETRLLVYELGATEIKRHFTGNCFNQHKYRPPPEKWQEVVYNFLKLVI